MSPLYLGAATQHTIFSNNTGQPMERPSQIQNNHPTTLTSAVMSSNAMFALDQVEAQSNGFHQLLALLARNGIADNSVHIESNHGAVAHYTQEVAVPGGQVANLTIRSRLNEQSQYDIIGIDLHMPSTGKTDSIYLSKSCDTDFRDNYSNDHGNALISAHLASQYSRSELAAAIIRQINTQDFTGPPLPSGASISTQSMMLSLNDGKIGRSTAISSQPSQSATIQNAHVE